MKKKTLVTLFAGTAILGASIAPAAAHATTTGTTPANVEMTSGSLPDGPGDGTQAGWTVTAGITEMKNGAAALEGSITFAQTGAVAKYNETAKTYSRDVAAFAADPGSPEFAGTTIPVGGAAVPIATAAVGKGQGTWDSELSNVKLNITTPSSQITTGAYTGNVTWTLVAAP
ncbi:WxL domain-containing protein [Enterococcus faecalis]|uniref:WxL domain-containing protein n=1 Tax=Enterococcus faecalis TaxID=1351 RepID=UPI003B783D11